MTCSSTSSINRGVDVDALDRQAVLSGHAERAGDDRLDGAGQTASAQTIVGLFPPSSISIFRGPAAAVIFGRRRAHR